MVIPMNIKLLSTKILIYFTKIIENTVVEYALVPLRVGKLATSEWTTYRNSKEIKIIAAVIILFYFYMRQLLMFETTNL